MEFTFPEEPARTPAPPVPIVTGAVVLAPEVQKHALAFPQTARMIEITDQATLTRANDFRNDIRAMAKKVDETFDPLIEQAHCHHKALLAQKKRFREPLDEAEKLIKPKISDYLAEEDRKRFEAERAAALAKTKAEKIAEKAIDKAHDLTSKGKLEQADAVVEKASDEVDKVLAGAPPIPEKPKAEGFRERTLWYAEITDREKIPRKYMIPDMPTLNKLAVALKHGFDIPGVDAKWRKA